MADSTRFKLGLGRLQAYDTAECSAFSRFSLLVVLAALAELPLKALGLYSRIPVMPV
ncbi:hypothetical protein ACRN98_17845 [Shewanella oncorhynchi]|uniref:hypothetical protein n=1 Tax=Shewanella TaxID=22 RepID=UPI0021D7FDDE|nr:hypothetical protein [Shewanella sp. SM69]MCU8040421.1 hypothetical protein [Shewanella sp. SM69]